MPDTAADELRAAAAKLRAATTDATPGPWTVDWPTGQWGDADRDAELIGGGKQLATYNVEYRGPLNAAYTALVNPAVGLLLADWLASFDGIDINEHAAMAEDATHALRIARAINQETT